MRKILLCIIPMIFLVGCYDRIEMEDRNYIITLGVDKYDNTKESKSQDINMEKRFTTALAMAQLESDAKNSQGEASEKSGIEVTSGTTLLETLQAGDKYNSKASYYGQLKTVIAGEDVMKDRSLFFETVETMIKSNEINTNVMILAGKGNASDIMDKIMLENSSSGLYIWDFYKSTGKSTIWR